MTDPTDLPFPFTAPGDRLALLRLLASLLDETDLSNIAHQDRGDDADLHLAALRPIANQLAIPSPLDWHPREVLELMRWTEQSHTTTPDSLHRMHRQRAFSAATLLIASADPESPVEACSETLIQLLESLDHLSLQTDQPATDLLLWLIQTSTAQDLLGFGELPFLALGLLYCALPHWPDADLVTLADWILESVHNLTWEQWYAKGEVPRGTWLLSVTGRSLLPEKWHAFGPRLAARLTPAHGDRLTLVIRDVAGKLANGTSSR